MTNNVYTATSADHGKTWSCSKPVSTNTKQAIFPWLAATSAGVDLVYYGHRRRPTRRGPSTSPRTTGNPTGSGAPQQVVTVHKGAVCEGGISCTGGRQLLDDFGVDTDSNGWAHIAYSHDNPDLGGAGSYTGSAVQTRDRRIGFLNN